MFIPFSLSGLNEASKAYSKEQQCLDVTSGVNGVGNGPTVVIACFTSFDALCRARWPLINEDPFDVYMEWILFDIPSTFRLAARVREDEGLSVLADCTLASLAILRDRDSSTDICKDGMSCTSPDDSLLSSSVIYPRSRLVSVPGRKDQGSVGRSEPPHRPPCRLFSRKLARLGCTGTGTPALVHTTIDITSDSQIWCHGTRPVGPGSRILLVVGADPWTPICLRRLLRDALDFGHRVNVMLYDLQCKAREASMTATLGGAYFCIERYNTARSYAQRQLQLGETMGNRRVISQNIMFVAYNDMEQGMVEQAIPVFERELQKAIQHGDHHVCVVCRRQYSTNYLVLDFSSPSPRVVCDMYPRSPVTSSLTHSLTHSMSNLYNPQLKHFAIASLHHARMLLQERKRSAVSAGCRTGERQQPSR